MPVRYRKKRNDKVKVDQPAHSYCLINAYSVYGIILVGLQCLFTICLPVSPAYHLCKQFGSSFVRSDLDQHCLRHSVCTPERNF